MAKRNKALATAANAACPCGSGLQYRRCCGPYLSGQREAPTAEALMRARYSANVEHHQDFLVRTWHPDTLPEYTMDHSVAWLGLDVWARDAGQALDRTGTVTYEVRYRRNGVVGSVSERGRFERLGARWVYVGGEEESA
ncbi:MAG: YchJ family protein [Acidimicrobiales bacterium]